MDPAAGPRQRWRDRARCIRSTHFVMEQKMMRGIRHRAEQTRRDQTAVYIRKYAEGSTRFTLTARWYRQMRRKRVDVGRTFPAPHHQEQRTDVPTDYSKIVVPSTYGNSHMDALRCGEVLSSVLLECTIVGLATCTLTHVTELDACRHTIAVLIG